MDPFDKEAQFNRGRSFREGDNMLDFYKTGGGRKMIDGTLPRIMKALERIAKGLSETKSCQCDQTDIWLKLFKALLEHPDCPPAPYCPRCGRMVKPK